MIDLEFEILSMSILNQDLFSSVIENEHLFVKWQLLYNVLLEMYDEGINFSYPSIHPRLETRKNREYANEIISKLGKSPGSLFNFTDYLSQLKQIRRSEKIHDMAKTIIEVTRKKSMRSDEIEAYIAETIDSLDADYTDDGINISDYAKCTLDEIYPVNAVHKTGIPELDEKLYGLKDGHLIIIAARPSRGKTALVLQIAESLAFHNPDDKEILIFSLEAPKNELYARYLSRKARVPSWRIEYKKMNEDEFQRVMIAHDFYKTQGYKIKIYDSVFDINRIKAKIKKTRNLKAVIVDYLQLMGSTAAKSREQEVASISRQFKLLAQRLNIPIILLSQLNRSIEIQNREPELSDLRESGAIEQDANVVLFIHSAEDQHHEEIEETAFYLKKNKNGRTGKINTSFNKPFFEFGLTIRGNTDSDIKRLGRNYEY
jgi:replicative DNA helicase